MLNLRERALYTDLRSKFCRKLQVLLCEWKIILANLLFKGKIQDEAKESWNGVSVLDTELAEARNACVGFIVSLHY